MLEKRLMSRYGYKAFKVFTSTAMVAQERVVPELERLAKGMWQ